MIPSHCTGIFSSRKRTGINLSRIPARNTSRGLVQSARNLPQPRDVILVVLHRIERH